MAKISYFLAFIPFPSFSNMLPPLLGWMKISLVEIEICAITYRYIFILHFKTIKLKQDLNPYCENCIQAIKKYFTKTT